MKAIKILHLYYDLLNLYGEQGNIIALKNGFKNQNVETSIDKLSVNDDINFNNYDIVYIGTGSKDNILIALEDIIKRKKAINEAIKKGIYFISTGNSHELFGQYIEYNNVKYDCLGIFDYYAKENKSRIVGECFMKYETDNPIIGFQNRSCLLNNTKNHLFTVLSGNADNLKSEFEGYHEYNFYGSYILGPLLIRNPEFTNKIIKDLLEKNNLKYHSDNDTMEYKAYQEYLKNFYTK